jgi:hypothetical protein
MSLSGSYGESNTSNSSSQQGTSTTSSDFTKTPVNASQIQDALNAAQNLFTNGNPTSSAGLSNVNGAANAAYGLFGAASPALTGTLNGSYLSASNPYFQNMFQGVANTVTPTVAGSFEGNGRYGSGAFANALSGALTQQAANLGYSNYAAERGLQSSAQQSLPSYVTGMMSPGLTQLNAGYLPIQQYIQALAALSPGQTGTSTSNTATTGNSTSQGDQSGWNVGAKVGYSGATSSGFY